MSNTRVHSAEEKDAASNLAMLSASTFRSQSFQSSVTLTSTVSEASQPPSKKPRGPSPAINLGSTSLAVDSVKRNIPAQTDEVKTAKRHKISSEPNCSDSTLASPTAGNNCPMPMGRNTENEVTEGKKRTLQPSPFFYYRDHSGEVDNDPLSPLTAPARVPNFPAKMHAILSRDDLSDVVAWLPHGRSWRVLKPREFEVKVIPAYFEHSKFSSFIRQANGWGFRRITQGRDRNSYYNELFLRGLPHLCKKMRRPGVSEKVAADPGHEPDFYKISELHPLPEKAVNDETILLEHTLRGGPKARMPVHIGIDNCVTDATQNIDFSSMVKESETLRSVSTVAGFEKNMHSMSNATVHHTELPANQSLQNNIPPQIPPNMSEFALNNLSLGGHASLFQSFLNPLAAVHPLSTNPHIHPQVANPDVAMNNLLNYPNNAQVQSVAAAAHLNAAASHLKKAFIHSLAFNQSSSLLAAMSAAGNNVSDNQGQAQPQKSNAKDNNNTVNR